MIETFDTPPFFVETFKVAEARKKYKEDFEFLRSRVCLFPKKTVEEQYLNRFPGRYGHEKSRLEEYFGFISSLKGDSEHFVWPRGYIGSDIVICGIAPGWTEEPPIEPMWLLGPSSSLLDRALRSWNVFFSNISKFPFYKNKYSESQVNHWLPYFSEELKILDPKVVLFLGKYEVYEKVQTTAKRVQVYHPSYVLKTNLFESWSLEIKVSLEDADCQKIRRPR